MAHNGPREATFRGMCPLTPGPLGPALSLFSETPNAESPFCSDYVVALVPSMPASVGGPFPSGKPTTYSFFDIAGQVANPPPGRLITFIPSEAYASHAS